MRAIAPRRMIRLLVPAVLVTVLVTGALRAIASEPRLASQQDDSVAVVLVDAFPDLAGQGEHWPVCPGCDGEFRAGDALLAMDQPLPRLTLRVETAGAAPRDVTSMAMSEGRQQAVIDLQRPAAVTITLVTPPEGWAICPGRRDQLLISPDDYEDGQTARVSLALSPTCLPPGEVSSVRMGQDGELQAGNEDPGSTADQQAVDDTADRSGRVVAAAPGAPSSLQGVGTPSPASEAEGDAGEDADAEPGAETRSDAEDADRAGHADDVGSGSEADDADADAVHAAGPGAASAEVASADADPADAPDGSDEGGAAEEAGTEDASPAEAVDTDDDVDGGAGSGAATLAQPVDEQQPGRVSGVVFEDLDEDGEQDDDEPGLMHVEVRLESDVEQRVVATGLDGDYMVSGLPPGVYDVVVEAPLGLEPLGAGRYARLPVGGRDLQGVDFALGLALAEDDVQDEGPDASQPYGSQEDQLVATRSSSVAPDDEPASGIDQTRERDAVAGEAAGREAHGRGTGREDATAGDSLLDEGGFAQEDAIVRDDRVHDNGSPMGAQALPAVPPLGFVLPHTGLGGLPLPLLPVLALVATLLGLTGLALDRRRGDGERGR